eukprot:1184763-Prorocentrum_minimum.AAC.2
MSAQHDRAGGCLHTFEEGGFEFDTGLHYVSGVSGSKGNRALGKIVDTLTDGAIEWESTGDVVDVAVFEQKGEGGEGERTCYPIPAGEGAYREMLVRRFPEEAEAIDKYFRAIKVIYSLAP